MYLVINKWVIAVNVSDFSSLYLLNHWTLDIGVLGYIGIVWPKEHSPEVWSVPPVTPCIQHYGTSVNIKNSSANKVILYLMVILMLLQVVPFQSRESCTWRGEVQASSLKYTTELKSPTALLWHCTINWIQLFYLDFSAEVLDGCQ